MYLHLILFIFNLLYPFLSRALLPGNTIVLRSQRLSNNVAQAYGGARQPRFPEAPVIEVYSYQDHLAIFFCLFIFLGIDFAISNYCSQGLKGDAYYSHLIP